MDPFCNFFVRILSIKNDGKDNTNSLPVQTNSYIIICIYVKEHYENSCLKTYQQ